MNRSKDDQFLSKPLTITKQHWKDDVRPLVSISCVTYNHAPYIRETIESFLMQKTTFPVEILIHDDASIDGTAKIIKEYDEGFKKLFFSVYQSENQYSQGVRGMMARFNFPRARGKYIALCEGDDYWTDPLKLQKQVDFLEANPEYSGAAHQSIVVYNDKVNKGPKPFREHNITDIQIEHLLDGRLFHTASFIFRSQIIEKNSLPVDITSSDRALFFLIATFGKIHYSNEVMCCYRKHTGGMSSWVTTEMMEKDLKIIPWISKINPKFPRHRYYQFLHLVALSYPSSLSFSKIIKHSFLYIYHSFFIRPYDLNNLKTFTARHLPAFFTKVKTISKLKDSLKRLVKHDL